MESVRRFLRIRPLALLAASYAAGAAIGYAARVPAPLWGCALTALAGAFALRRRPILICAAMMLLGAAVTAACAARPPAAEWAEARVTGVVCLEPARDEERTVLTLDRARIDGQALGYRLRVYAYEAIEARVDDAVAFVGSVWQPQGRRNPGGFDFARWLWDRGVGLCATARAETMQIERPLRRSPRGLLAESRARLGGLIDSLYPEDAGLLRALLLGDKGELPTDLTEDYRRAGVVHLLAISGLHVSCLALFLDWLLKRLGLSRRAAFGVTLPLLAFYAALVGFTPSVTRAVFMYLLLRAAPLNGRPSDALTRLLAALWAILLVRPLAIADAGLILSFAAVAGILALVPPLLGLLRAPKRGWLRGLLESLAVSLCASAAIAPALIQFYGTVAPYSPLANLIAVPLITLALPIAFASLLLGALYLPLGALAARLASLLLGLISRFAAWVAALPGASVMMGAWPAWLVGLYALALCGCSAFVPRVGRRRLALGALAALCFVAGPLLCQLRAPDGLQIDFLDVGEADAAVVWAQGTPYLVDAGEAGGPVAGYLAYRGLAPRAVFLTHPHADHYGGFAEVAALCRVETIYLPECWPRLTVPADIASSLQSAQARGSRVVYLKAGDEVRLSERVVARVLYPPEGANPANLNDASLALRIEYGAGSALLAGDLQTLPPLTLDLDCDVMKASHHGEDRAGGELLLRAASPSALVISVGRNGYGHPAEALLARAERLGAQIYRTDRCGMVAAQIRPDGFSEVQPFLPPEA